VTFGDAKAREKAMRSRLWTTERVGVLQRLWADGKTAVEIAAALDGVSRSAVLGMIFRLRLGAEDGAGSKTARTNPAKSRAPAAAPLAPARRHRRRRKKNPIADTPLRRSGPVGLFDLTNDMCRWPYGQLGGRNYLFCGAPGADLTGGIPYCALHMRRAYLIPPRAAAAKTGKINKISNSGSSACLPGAKAPAFRTKSPTLAPR
jgi:GcrA cell cycle regulator